MRAVVVQETGGPEVLRVVEWPEPAPGPGEVSITVDHVGVNFTDVRSRRGDGLVSPPLVPGIEAAGRVRALGDGVDSVEVGQYVVALTGTAAYAEVVTAAASRVAVVPDEYVGQPVAAGMAKTVSVAIQLLRDAGRVLPGESILVHGAAGGVGSAIAQVAGAYGYGDVYGTVGSAEKCDYARGFGFAAVFVRDDFLEPLRAATGGRGVDVVFDPVGGETRARSFEALADLGRLVHFGNASMAPEVAPDALAMRARALGYFGYSSAKWSGRDAEGFRDVFLEAVDLVTSGRVRVDVTEVLPLEQAGRAHERLESGAARGKIVLTTGSSG